LFRCCKNGTQKIKTGRETMAKYQIEINKAAENQTKYLKALRLIGNIGLGEAKDLAEHTKRFKNMVVVAGVDKNVAQHIAEQLQEAGAQVSVTESPMDHPMTWEPRVNTKYIWTSLRTVKQI